MGRVMRPRYGREDGQEGREELLGRGEVPVQLQCFLQQLQGGLDHRDLEDVINVLHRHGLSERQLGGRAGHGGGEEQEGAALTGRRRADCVLLPRHVEKATEGAQELRGESAGEGGVVEGEGAEEEAGGEGGAVGGAAQGEGGGQEGEGGRGHWVAVVRGGEEQVNQLGGGRAC